MREVCYCDYGACGYCCAIGVMQLHTGAKPGCELVTLLSDRRLLLPCVSYMGHTYRSITWGLAAHIF